MKQETYERLRRIPRTARAFEDRPRQQWENDLEALHAFLDVVAPHLQSQQEPVVEIDNDPGETGGSPAPVEPEEPAAPKPKPRTRNG